MMDLCDCDHLHNFYQSQLSQLTSTSLQASVTTHRTAPAASWQLDRNINPISIANLSNRNANRVNQGQQDGEAEDGSNAADRPDSPPLPDEKHQANISPGAGGSKYAKRQEKKYNQWNNSLNQLKGERLEHLPTHLAISIRQQQQEADFIQTVVNEAWRYHDCVKHADASKGQLPSMQFVRSTQVTYFSWTCRRIINIPIWCCSKCKKQHTPCASLARCWASSPVAPEWWIHESVLIAYNQWVGEGIGSDGEFCVTSVHVFFWGTCNCCMFGFIQNVTSFWYVCS